VGSLQGTTRVRGEENTVADRDVRPLRSGPATGCITAVDTARTLPKSPARRAGLKECQPNGLLLLAGEDRISLHRSRRVCASGAQYSGSTE